MCSVYLSIDVSALHPCITFQSGTVYLDRFYGLQQLLCTIVILLPFTVSFAWFLLLDGTYQELRKYIRDTELYPGYGYFTVMAAPAHRCAFGVF